MAIVYNHMQDWIFEIKELNLVSKLLLERMISLSSDGEQQVFINRDSFAKKLGVDPSSITRAFKQLIEFEFVELVPNSNPFNKIKNFKITAKALSDRELHNAIIENDLKQYSIVAKDNSRALHNATSEPCIMQFSSLDRKKGRNNKEEEREPPSNTHSYDEVFSMFTLNAKELSKSYPSLLALDLKLIAMKYFNYREEQKWKGVKDLSLNVSNWLIDEIKHLQTTPTQTTKKGDFFGNLNKLVQMNSPETLEVSQGKKIIDVDASIVTD